MVKLSYFTYDIKNDSTNHKLQFEENNYCSICLNLFRSAEMTIFYIFLTKRTRKLRWSPKRTRW